jgi:hypothetical protein
MRASRATAAAILGGVVVLSVWMHLRPSEPQIVGDVAQMVAQDIIPPAIAQPYSQCIASASAGGSVNAITIPSLPCGLTTNLLILTASGANTITTPTLQPLGQPALTIVRQDLTPLQVGDISGVGYRALLSSTGSQWVLLNPANTSGTQSLVVGTTPVVGGTQNLPLTEISGVLQQDTLTQMMDLEFGNSQGDILIRGSSTWQVLGPGTAGNCLETLGAGFNPQWSNSCGSGGGGTAYTQTYQSSLSQFTPGVTTVLTLTNPPSSASSGLWVFWDGVWVDPTQYTLSGTTLTFNNAIQAQKVVTVISAAPGGGVLSVGLTASPSGVFGVSGSPVTSSGTFGLSLNNQSANTALMGPTSGSATAPGFRGLVAADLPASGITAGTYAPGTITFNSEGMATAATNSLVCVVDGHQYSTINAAITAGCSNVKVAEGGTSLTGPITLSGNGQSITCSAPYVVNVPSGDTLTLSGDNIRVDGCVWYGPGTTVANAGAAVVITGDQIWFEHNVVTNFGHVGSGFSGSGSRLDEVQETGGLNHWIDHNYIVGNGDKALTQESFSANPLQYSFVTDNVMEGVDIDASNSAAVTNSVMSGNALLAGAHASADDECIWSGGNPATENGVWDHNNCYLLQSLTATGGNGDAISMGSNDTFTFDGNNVYAGGFCANQYVEMNTETKGHIDGNSIFTNNAGCIGNGAGFNIENAQNVTANDNSIWGFPNGGQAMLVVAGAASGTCPSGCNNFNVEANGNVVFFLTGDTASGSGGIVFINSSSQTTSNVEAIGNVVNGTTDSAGTFGIQFEPNGLAMSTITAGPNTIVNLPLGVNAVSGTTQYCYVAGANYAATPTAGVSSSCH